MRHYSTLIIAPRGDTWLGAKSGCWPLRPRAAGAIRAAARRAVRSPQPDFVVVLASRTSIIRDRRIRGVPDVIVEILSLGTTAYDQQVKLEAYARAGVPEYAIVDPATRTVSHDRLEAPGRYADPHVRGAAEVMSFDCLPTIRVPVGELFAGAPDTTL